MLAPARVDAGDDCRLGSTFATEWRHDPLLGHDPFVIETNGTFMSGYRMALMTRQ
jgi:hypothetical protein